jgi:hypothetical protein
MYPQPPTSEGDDDSGSLLLGRQAATGQPFSLTLAEMSRGGVFVPGITGRGKTTTITRLAGGVLSLGGAVVVVDCKGAGFGGGMHALARQYGVPLTVVDPADPQSIGYDVCSGDAASVANKLVGAFTFSADAEIYKNIALEAISLICKAMLGSGIPVTLDGLYDTLGKGGLARLGRDAEKRGGVTKSVRLRLEDLEDSGTLVSGGREGLRRRLGALMEGKYGELLARRPALDWQHATESCAVSYLALSATASSEDSELFGRVIIQDLKQLCASRLRAIRGGAELPFVLACFDEFAALQEAPQIVDLLTQAREARISVLLATQFLPKEVAIRAPALSAGVLIAHGLEGERDAEAVAAQFGTRTVPEITSQVDFETGETMKGSMRSAEQYVLHPNKLKKLGIGETAVLVRGEKSQRNALVSVERGAT